MSQTTFRAEDGKSYTVRINAPLAERVRQEVGVNIVAYDGSGLDELAQDPVKQVNVLAVLLADQIREHGATDASFGESLVGEAIDFAFQALEEAIVNFFPKSKQNLLRVLRRKSQAMQDLAMQQLDDPTMQQAIQAKLREQMLNSLTLSGGATS